MSTSAVNSASINQQLQQYFQTRQSDLRQLGQALSSGNLTAAQTQFTNITALGDSGPFAGGNAFKITGRQDDFNALGQALQSGDLAGAQQAFGALASTFKTGGAQTDPPSATAASASASSAGPEIVLNLSNTGSSSTPEQITINIANAASGGGEQVSLSVGNQGSNPQQVTFNLAANSNEQIVLNLLSASSAGSTGTTPASGGGLSVSA